MQLKSPNTVFEFSKLVIHLENSGLRSYSCLFCFWRLTISICDNEINLHVKTVAERCLLQSPKLFLLLDGNPFFSFYPGLI